MVFDARAELKKIEETHKDFTFVDIDGNSHKLPNIQLLTGEQVARLMSGDEKVIAEVDEAAFQAIQSMPIGVGERLAEAWIDAGGDAGKEQSESSSTESNGEDSK